MQNPYFEMGLCEDYFPRCLYSYNIMSSFQDIDTEVYQVSRERYLPIKIKYLFIAESPPAFRGQNPIAYFYFDNVPKADSLFYTLVKAVYDLDFVKALHYRPRILSRFRDDGFYLIDAVSYPINKTKEWIDVSNFEREKVITKNKMKFEKHLNRLIEGGHMDDNTAAIIIKETVFNAYANHRKVNVLNKRPIGFPRYIKDWQVVESIRRLIR